VGNVIDIYKTSTCILSMKLKDILSKVVENKKNGQFNTCIKKNQLKKVGISKEDLFNMDIEPKLKKLLFED